MSEKKNDLIPEPIYDDNGTLFDKANYIIPLYQRAFAWEYKEIRQLIDDIYDCDSYVSHYYLGSLIVSKDESGKCEVIDGQQRLTALYLLLTYLGQVLPKESLTYDCRDKSNFTLVHLTELLDENKADFFTNHSEKIEEGLVAGLNDIQSIFNGEIKHTKNGLRGRKIDKSEFIEKLKKVRLYIIEVPENTDLNRYFETMNMRGEQLEQHDILKAELMRELKTEQERAQFAIIWDACSDMNGYVQMHFSVKNRNLLFGYHWCDVPLFEWKDNQLNINDTADFAEPLIEILHRPIAGTILNENSDKKIAEKDGIDENESRVRFKSIMGFPYFLLHVLSVFVAKENNATTNTVSLDDKKLLQSFRTVMDKGMMNGKKTEKATFVKKFVTYLLKCRFLFDKYIIKREYKNDAREDENSDDDGIWSLKELKVSEGRTSNYSSTRLKKGERTNKVQTRAEENLMLQSCLRVSFLSQKAMHWVTRLLTWLYDANYEDLTELKNITENIARKDVKEFLDEKNFYRGVQTPHIVFNYLDYLLWTKRDEYKKLNFEDFAFGFRNSVEHWYPQHPSSDSFDLWEEIDEGTNCPMRDGFGNLCIMSRVVNSRFSNKSPIAKQKDHESQIKKGSLKLRLMSSLIESNTDWRSKEVCGKHGNEMIALLCKACNIEDIPNMG